MKPPSPDHTTTPSGPPPPTAVNSGSSQADPQQAHIEEQFVPIPTYTRVSSHDYKSPTPIHFDPASSTAADTSSDGTPFVMCLSGEGLRDPDQPLFQAEWEKGRLTIGFVLLWPGYEHIVWGDTISVLGLNGGFITRRELAFLVASQFKDFIAKCDELNVQCTKPEWRVGAGGYGIANMCLSALWSPADGIWQASVRVRNVVE